MLSMLSGAAPASAWNAAECSLSTGMSSVPARCERGHEHLARRDEAFLVGEREPPAVARGLERRLDAGRTHDRRHHAVGGLGRCRDHGRMAGGDLDAGPRKEAFSSP